MSLTVLTVKENPLQRTMNTSQSLLTPIQQSKSSTNVRYQVLAVGCSMALVTYIHRQAFVRATPEIRADLHLNADHIGYVASAFLLAYGIFQIPCGMLSDRIGARHLLTLLVLGWSVVTGLTALAGSAPAIGLSPFVFLLAIRFLFGALQAGAFPIWSRVMTDWMTLSTRATGQGVVWMSSRVGGAIGPYLFLWLFLGLNVFGFRFEGFHTWTTPLLILSWLGVLWCAMFWPWFRNRPEQMRQVNAVERELIAAGRPTEAKSSTPIPWNTLLRSVNVWALCAMYGFVGFAGNFVTNLLPVYLKDDRQLSDEMTTRLTGLPLVFGLVSCSLGGVISDLVIRRWKSRKWGRRITGLVGLALAGLAITAVPWVQATWLLGALFVASFFFNDINMAPSWAACADVGERHAGTISGAMNMTGQFFGAVGMSLAGKLLYWGNPKLLFFLFGCSYGVAALCWLAVDVTRPLSSTVTKNS